MHIIKYKPYIELEMSKLTIYHFYYLKIYRKWVNMKWIKNS